MSGGTLALGQTVVADTLQTNLTFLDDRVSEHFTRDEFMKLPKKDVELIIRTYITDPSDFALVMKNYTMDEIYDILNSTDVNKTIDHAIGVYKIREAIAASVSAAETFLKSAPPPGSPGVPPPSVKSPNVTNWTNASPAPVPSVIDNDDGIVVYKFDYNNPKSLFLVVIFAVPELLNQLILKFRHTDNDGVTTKVVESDTIKNYKEEFIDSLRDSTKSDQDVLENIAILGFLSFSKIVEIMHDLFEELAIQHSETRTILVDFILEVSTIGISVNEGEEIWGNEDNVIEGVSINFDPDNDVLEVVCLKPYVKKYTELDFFKNWPPSSFYTYYNIHARKLPKPLYRTEKEFWDRVVFDAYDATKSSKNTIKYIKSRLK